MIKSFYIGLAAAGALILFGCGSKGGDSGQVATVGGKPITMQQFRKYLEQKSSVLVRVQNQNAALPVAVPLGYQALEDLISQQVTLQLAAEEGVEPKAADITAEIAYRTKLNPAFIKQQTDTGISLQQIKDSLAIQLAQERLVTKGITVTMQEVDEFIKKNPKQFEEAATAEMLWVVVKDDEAKAKVDQALSTGQDFQKVAITYSVDPNIKELSGKYAQTRVDQMVEPIKKAINGVQPGKQTGWVKFQDGQAKFLVQTRTAARPMKITEAQKEFVQRQLAVQRGRMANDLEKRLQEKLKTTKVVVEYDPLKQLWAKTEETMKKAASDGAKTGTTGTIPSGTTGPATTGQ